MKLLHPFFLFILSLHIANCSSPSKTNNQTENSTENKWEVLVSERLCSVTEPKNVIIKTEAEFDQLWKETQKNVENPPAKPVVDFKTKWVVGCFLGTVAVSGHTISITSAKSETDKTRIEVNHSIPGVGCITAQVMEYPYIIASINHLVPSNVEFTTKSIEVKCE